MASRILDLSGRVVRRLASSERTADGVTFRWDGTGDDGVASAAGVYSLRGLQHGKPVGSAKVVKTR